MRALIVNLLWKLVLVGALFLCTAIGWFLYDMARQGRLDNILSEWLRTASVTLQVMFRTDPILTLILFPLGILVVLILFGLLLWLQQDR